MHALCFLVFLAAMQGTQAVEYSVTNNALSTPGGVRFRDQIGDEYAKQTLDSATQFIWGVFQQNAPADRKDVQKTIVIVSKMGLCSTEQVDEDGHSDQFFVWLLGKTVDQLWQDYKAKYGNIP
ncbi:basic secretory protein [Spatholobus suberectus]|nr:basic secretory protein [Spatholobus suberectus]